VKVLFVHALLLSEKQLIRLNVLFSCAVVTTMVVVFVLRVCDEFAAFLAYGAIVGFVCDVSEHSFFVVCVDFFVAVWADVYAPPCDDR